MSDPDIELFQVILEALDRITLYITGYDLARFLDDQRTIDAVALNFVVVRECARRLSPAGRFEPAGDWIDMANLRHRIAHGYASVDRATLWGIASKDAAALRPKIAALLGLD